MARHKTAERPYESLFICPAETPQKNIDALVEKIKSAITQTNGTVRSVQNWGRRRLSYPIKRHKDGLFIFVDFNGGSQAPEALKNLYRVTDIVIRHMTCDRVELKDPPVRRIPGSPEAIAAAAAAAGAAPETGEKKEAPSAPKEASHGQSQAAQS